MKKKNNRGFVRPVEDRITSIKRCGKDVEEAVQLALAELKATEDEVDVEILEMPTKGFFGIGAKLAEVQVTLKEKNAKGEKSERKERKGRGPLRKEEVTEEELKGYGASRESAGGNKRDSRKKRDRNKDKNKEASSDVNSEIASLEEPIRPIVDMESLSPLDENNEGLVFLKKLIQDMGIEATVEGKTDGKDIYFFMEGKDTGTIIGKRGATLDAIQYLTSLVINKSEGEYIRVVVDAENYRAKREKALEKLAARLADKVARTKRSYKLEPMNPYERKVIHATLQKDGRVTTRSEGQDPSRRIIIDVK